MGIDNGSILASESESLSGCRWHLFPHDESYVAAARQRWGIGDIVARVLFARSVPLDGIGDFINPKVHTLLPDPLRLKDMDRAVERISRAIASGEKIGIFGDYDVDGATSSAVLYRFLRAVGASSVSIHIPDRKTEGYGLGIIGLSSLKSDGCTLVISVDCGVAGFAEIDWANQNGLDIVVIDHHEAESGVPNAAAVVDPKRIDDTSGLYYLAACGVVFLLCVALNRRLRALGHFSDARPEPDLITLLDLVALGTVCDVVPLIGANRAFVSTGLKVMASRANLGLKALADVANLVGGPSVYSLGYVLGPRINAGGRVGNSELGAKLLTTTDIVDAQRIASHLDGFNSERKDIETAVLSEAAAMAEQSLKPGDGFVFVAGEGWHTGVIGIIAGRIKERFNLPTFVATIDPKGSANGSVRSILGIDIGACVLGAKEAGILSAGGGHSMAAGFTLLAAKIPDFRDFIRDYIHRATHGERIIPALHIDSIIDIGGITEALIEDLATLEPFGTGHDEPRFAVMNAKLTGADAVGSGHIRCYFSSDNGKSITAMSFRSVGTDLGEALLGGVGERFRIAGKVKLNVWNSKRQIQMILDDVAKVA